ncbi:hypothetical protein F5Y07DRAFT_303423 [Xylaria sp. FL0933]|nr:hypothetical protein F5Y07DRAFT_303423 [Xylaria sp. FL0933]
MGDSRNTKSSELDRRASHRASTRLSRVLRDDDVDDYDLQAMAISDGFRPTQMAQNHASHVARPSQSSVNSPVARTVSPRPSSVSKPIAGQESLFSAPNNGLERAPVRSSSVSTDSPEMSTETPYEGPRGPSHPYQMYPQDVRLARTASLATTSTAPLSERSYNGPRGPTHPYSIYPQNIGASEDGSDDRSPQREINVGFPGTADNYRRRIGPDGEEVADMIGPDGHTEQLPPYTRYPVEAYAQKSLGINVDRPVPTSSPAQQSEQQAAQTLDIPGAGGIGLATRNPEFSSVEDLNQLNSPQSRRSVRSMVSEASHHSINTAALAVANEKEVPNWKTAARRRLWGVVPCWALALAAIILLLLGVVVGTVIGTIFGRQLGKHHDNDDSSYSETKPPGFVPLPTVPPGLPDLEEGPYSLPLMSPLPANNCFQNSDQVRAWNCDAILSQLTMTVHRKHDSADTTAYALDLNYNHSYTEDSNVYSYGVQPPLLMDQQLILVNDTFELEKGPAWAFAVPYNKTIILPEQYLTYTPSDEVQRRMMFGFDFKRKGLAQSGERPWVCTWPSTILEIFIYASQNNSWMYPMGPGNTRSGSSSPPPTGSTTGPQPTGQYRRGEKEEPYEDYEHDNKEDDDDFPHTHPPTQIPSSSSSMSSTTSTPPSTSSTSSAEPNWFSPPPMPPPPFPPYPKIIKVEERRDPEVGAPPPTCRQIVIGEKGVAAQPVLDDNGNPVEIQIAEMMPKGGDKQADRYFNRRSSIPHMWFRRDGSELSDCGCIWWLN